MKEDLINNNESWRDKISNAAQLGGIETAVLDNGAGKGTRIAWMNTGTGLRYKVVIDRAMDIADAFYNEHSLAWISHLGITAPQPFSDKGIDWIRTFGGGLLVTCGLTHIGGPEADGFGERGLHGQVSNIPAEIVSIIQPDPVAGNMEMSITGIIRQTHPLGVRLALRRTISATLGKAAIRIHDEVINKGNMPAPHMLLYHCNFGWPLVDAGAEIIWDGVWTSREIGESNKIFKEGNRFRECVAPIEDHNGGGEEAAYIDIKSDASGNCKSGIHNCALGIAVVLNFKKAQLPWLTNWLHFGKGEYVVGLEPGTNPPVGQAKAREQNQLIELLPEETRSYDLQIEVLHDEITISKFLNNQIS
ncbi:MAG: aldose 1-epimerase family protein [Sphingobacteriaceae bacterium]